MPTLSPVRLGRMSAGPTGPGAVAATLVALRVGDLLALDELSSSQLARRLDLDVGPLARLLDEAERQGLVRVRDGRYSLTRAGARWCTSTGTQVSRQRRTTSA